MPESHGSPGEPATARRLLLALDEAASRIETLERKQNEPIAIIGMACRFPGHATDPESYWQLLSSCGDGIVDVPENRWSKDAWYDADPDAPGKIVTTRGGFLDDVEQFDYAFFGLSRREALTLDPQHRLLLEVGWEALESAGQTREAIAKTATGVFVGITTNDYARTITSHQSAAALDGYFNSGNALNAAAGRMSYFLGLHGPSMAIDSACSSSLVSVHIACQNLRLGECDMALAGGVNLILAPEVSVAASRAHMLSPDGRCKTFDAAADGYGRGEGCGVIVLKRLSDALAARDPICAVIRGSAVNHDGASGGFTVPNGVAQQDLIRRALSNAKVAPEQIQYVETHGTGTPLGDPIEVNALGEVFRDGRSQEHPLLIGSVKANIGHLESAAAIAGLIKVLLALQHRCIPPQRPVSRLNPHIKWDSLTVRVPSSPTPWPSSEAPRCAGVSSFGASGTNAHVIVEEAPSVDVPAPVRKRPCHILTLSARTQPALRELASRYAARIEQGPDVHIADLCFSANTGRSQFAERVALIVSSREDAIDALRAVSSGVASPNVAAGTVKSGTDLRLGFWFNPASPIAPVDHPAFRRAADSCEKLAGSLGLTAGSHLLTSFTSLVAFVELLSAWGIRPSAVGGSSSLAQLVARWAAGMLSLADALRLAAGKAAEDDVSVTPAALTFADRFDELRCDHAITIGPGPAGLVLWPPQNKPADGLMRGLAELYVRGVAIDWRSFDDGYLRRHVPLPSYPWQRERCWLDARPASETLELLLHGDSSGAMKRITSTQSLSEAELGLLPKLLEAIVQPPAPAARTEQFRDWLYELEWRPTPAYGLPLDGDILAAPRTVVSALQSEAVQLSSEEPIRVFTEVVAELEEVSVTYAIRALLEMGWSGRTGDRFTTAELGAQLGVMRQYERLLGRLLEILSEAGVLRPSGDGWEVSGRIDAADPSERLSRLRARCPEAKAELTLLERCGSALPQVMRGEQDPLPLLFPQGDLSTAASLYQDSPGATLMNGLVGKAVAGVLARWPAGRGLRVLEIGAGTGGTTTYVLPMLPMDRTGYAFTDISPSFVMKAAEKFGGDVEGRVLDIERDPKAQGFSGEQYDLIIAANVLHATRDLRQSLQHVRKLLASNGVLVLLEGTEKVRFIDLIFGLTEGWWRFEDRDLRPRHPLLRAREWTKLLEQSGFREAAALSEASGGILSRQAVIVAQADAEAGLQLPGHWLILADDGGVGDTLAERLRARGETCTVAHADSGSEDFDRMVRADLRGVVHLWSLNAKATPEMTAQELNTAHQQSCGTALRLVQALVRTNSATPPRLWLVTKDAVRVQGEGRTTGFVQSPIWGLARNAAMEHPEFRTLHVDLGEEPVEACADALLQELALADGEYHVAHRYGQRYAARLVRQKQIASRPDSKPIEVSAEGTYLITGGLGGLGLLVTEWLLSKGARYIVLAGRSSPTTETAERIAAMATDGRRVIAVQADVSERANVNRLIEKTRAELPPLKGIIHSAGVLDDAVLMQQDWQRFRRVMDPKVAGAWNLFTGTRDVQLDFLMLFSSGASLIGSAGQANHAAANAFLDSFSHYLESRGVRSVSINWGAWADVGAAAARNVENRVRANGLEPIPPQAGLQALGYLFDHPTAQAGVLPIDWSRFTADRESIPFLSALRPRAAVQSQATVSFLDELNATPDRKRRNLVARHVEQEMARVLAMKSSVKIDRQVGFFDLGMDSLTSMEFKNGLQKRLGVSLPNTLTFDYPTPDTVVDLVLRKVSTPAPETAPEPRAAAVSAAQLSSADLGSMLDAMIQNVEEQDVAR